MRCPWRPPRPAGRRNIFLQYCRNWAQPEKAVAKQRKDKGSWVRGSNDKDRQETVPRSLDCPARLVKGARRYPNIPCNSVPALIGNELRGNPNAATGVTRVCLSVCLSEMHSPERACAPTRSSKPHPRAPPPDPRLKPGPVIVTPGGVMIYPGSFTAQTG